MTEGTAPQGRGIDLDELKRMVLLEKVVAFVGAGVSKPPGHDWAELVKTMADNCGVRINGRPHPAVIDECIKKDELKCNAILREELPRHHATTRTLLGYITRLPFKAILTTNFDPWLLQHSRFSEWKHCRPYPNLPLNEGLAQCIYYLHGFFDSESDTSSVRDIVLGEESFVRAYGGASLLPGLLMNVFTFENVLFIGFGPTEPHVSQILNQAIETRRAIAANGGAMPRRCLLRAQAPLAADVPQLAGYAEETAKINALEIAICTYEPLDKDSRGLEKVISGWVDEGELKNRRAPFEPGYGMDAG